MRLRVLGVKSDRQPTHAEAAPASDRALSITAAGMTILAVMIITARFSGDSVMPRLVEESRPTVVTAWEDHLGGMRVFTDGGDPAATMVVFSDYRCAYCADTDRLLQGLSTVRNGNLEVRYRHFPMSSLSRGAALAVLCSQDQDGGASMHGQLFASRDSIGFISWSGFGARAGVRDTVALGRCMKGNEHATTLRADREAAEELGVLSTPTILLDSLLFVGVPSAAYVEAYVERAQARRASR